MPRKPPASHDDTYTIDVLRRSALLGKEGGSPFQYIHSLAMIPGRPWPDKFAFRLQVCFLLRDWIRVLAHTHTETRMMHVNVCLNYGTREKEPSLISRTLAELGSPDETLTARKGVVTYSAPDEYCDSEQVVCQVRFLHFSDWAQRSTAVAPVASVFVYAQRYRAGLVEPRGEGLMIGVVDTLPILSSDKAPLIAL